jgi:hypothetical protein
MRQQILARGCGWGNLNLVLEIFVILVPSVVQPPASAIMTSGHLTRGYSSSFATLLTESSLESHRTSVDCLRFV